MMTGVADFRSMTARLARSARMWMPAYLLVLACVTASPALAEISRIAVATGTTGSGGSTSISVAVPAGTQAGDLLLAVVAMRGGSGTSISGPAGWTPVQLTYQGSSLLQGIFYRYASASEPASYSAYFNHSIRAVGVIVTYRGVDGVAPVDVSRIQGNASSTSVQAGSVSVGLEEATLVGVFGAATGGTFSPPSGMTEISEVSTGSGSTGVAVMASERTLTTSGSTGSKTATVSTAADNIGGLVALKPAAALVTEYRFDECGYNGTAGEVRDSAGSNDGVAQNGLTTTPSGVIGAAAALDGYDKWVRTSIAMSRDWSLSFWMKLPASTSGGSRYHVLGSIAGGGDFAYFDDADGFRWGVYTTSGTTAGAYRLSALSTGWHHIALVGKGNQTRLYVDGSFRDSVSRKVSGGTFTFLGASYDYVTTNSAQGLRAPIDEMLVFSGALDDSEIASIRGNQASGRNYDGTSRAATACTVARFAVTATTSASTCTGHAVTISALDGAGNLDTTYTGTVILSTSTNRGAWSAGPSSGPVTETGSANDGAARYTFRSSDFGSVSLVLSDASADDLVVTATDSTLATVTGASGTISFRDNAFVIDVTDPLGTTAVAGRPHALRATLYRRDTAQSPANCLVATDYAGSKTLKAWYTAGLDHPAGATAPSINGGTALPAGVPGTGNVALTFSAGVAAFTLTTTDVGRFALNLRDDSRSFANAVTIDGSSPTVTVRPFALAITPVRKGSLVNPEGTATSGAKFVAAGDTFEASVGAYLWQSADDLNGDGVPDAGASVLDNGLAAHFAWPTRLSVATTAGLFTPGAGTPGTLGGTTTVPAGGFTGGVATVSDLTYSDVGSIGLDASATSYLNAAGANVSGTAVNASTGQAARVGRFYPDHFTLLSGASVSASCAAGGFTYMDEPGIGIRFTLEARSRSDTVAVNYQDGLYGVGTVRLVAENADSGTDLGARLTGMPAVTWSAGQYAFSASGAKFARLASPDGPYDSLVLGVTVTDPDGAVVTGADMAASSTGACGGGCTASALNGSSPTRVRFGRLRLGSALGAPQLTLPVPLTLEYWTGLAFATNALDSCTRLTNTQFAFSNFHAPLTACIVSATPAGTDAVSFASGRGNLRLTAPRVSGSVDLRANLGDTATGSSCTAGTSVTATPASHVWLRGNWNAGTYDRDPSARAVFGRHTNANDVIFLRESY
ncbi:MAG: hypothetical protein GC151_05780 [Betaproteobacteria bacterium]|nr:hypothetical protein [Betaproteobacteria bacterium]